MLGSKFRSRMVLGALLLSLGPVIFLFLFSYGLLNHSIEKWFSRPAEDVEYRTNVIASLLTEYATTNARDEAERIAAHSRRSKVVPDRQLYLRHGRIPPQRNHAARRLCFRPRRGSRRRQLSRSRSRGLCCATICRCTTRCLDAQIVRRAGREVRLGRARMGDNGWILVAMPLPQSYAGICATLRTARTSIGICACNGGGCGAPTSAFLLLLTVGVLFASTWLALYLSKMVTRPLVALAEATQEISRGRLDYRVDIRAGSEIGQLVESFNRMAADLEASRGRIEASRHDLADMNAQLEQRTRHIETILESVPSGVLSLDAARHIVHSNGAVRRLLRLDENPPVSAQSLSDLFPRSRRWRTGAHAAQSRPHGHHHQPAGDRYPEGEPERRRYRGLARSSFSVLAQRQPAYGYVVVLEDLTDILRAQKQTAWREVARRIAHEIKNPLTPLALSAERIRRHLERASPPDAASLNVIRQCAATIGSSVETVRTLVDEFSTLARFPASKPQPSDINSHRQSGSAMFDGRLDGIRSATIPGSGFAAGASRSGSHQARGCQSGRQCRRSGA